MMQRRSTTILAADMAGYAAMVAADELWVIERLRAIRRGLIEPAIARAGGRVVKLMGDGILVEFGAPDLALRVAIAFQREMVRHEAAWPETARIRFRIGINAGPVLIDGDDILGEAVNIAARLESLAAPGGICISRSVFDAVLPCTGVRLVEFGPQLVKNIPVAVEVWGVEIDGASTCLPRIVRKVDRP